MALSDVQSKPIEEVVSGWIGGFGRIKFTPKRKFSPVSSIVNINSAPDFEKNAGTITISKPDGWDIEGDVTYRIRFNGPAVITEMELRSPPDKRTMVSLYVGGNPVRSGEIRQMVVPAGSAMSVGPGLEIRKDQWLEIRTDWSLSGIVRYRVPANCGSDQIEHPLAHPPEPAEIAGPLDECGIMVVEPIKMVNDTDPLWSPQWKAKGMSWPGFVNAKTRRNMIHSRDLQRMLAGHPAGTKLYLDKVTINNKSGDEQTIQIHTPPGFWSHCQQLFTVSPHESGTEHIGAPVDTSKHFFLDMPDKAEVEVAFRAGSAATDVFQWCDEHRIDDATVGRNCVAVSEYSDIRERMHFIHVPGNMILDRIVFRPSDPYFVASVDVRVHDPRGGAQPSGYRYSVDRSCPNPSGLLGFHCFYPGWNICAAHRICVNIEEGHGQVLLFAHEERDRDSPEKKLYLERKPEKIINKRVTHYIGEIVSAGRATVAVRHNGNRRSSDMTYNDLARKYEWATTVDPVKLLE